MAYLDRDSDLKPYLGIVGTAEDAVLDDMLTAAQAAIDSYCDRTFEASADTTRTFDAALDTDGAVLYLDADLCAITTMTNGDAAATVVAEADYVLIPRDPPHRAIVLCSGAAVSWQGAISISGRWAYSIVAPAGIVQAMREYAGYMYRAYDRQIDPPERSTDSGMPKHIQQLLEAYRRLR